MNTNAKIARVGVAALAIGATAGPWRQPAHDLAHVTGRGGAGRLDPLAHQSRDLIICQGGRQVFADDRDLGLFLRDEVVAAA